jgi:hypothetical protein
MPNKQYYLDKIMCGLSQNLSDYVFGENWHIENHTALRGVNEFMSYFRWNLVREICI